MTHAIQTLFTCLFFLRALTNDEPVRTNFSPTSSQLVTKETHSSQLVTMETRSSQLVTMETRSSQLVTMETHGPSLPPRLRDCFHYEYYPTNQGISSLNAIVN